MTARLVVNVAFVSVSTTANERERDGFYFDGVFFMTYLDVECRWCAATARQALVISRVSADCPHGTTVLFSSFPSLSPLLISHARTHASVCARARTRTHA